MVEFDTSTNDAGPPQQRTIMVGKGSSVGSNNAIFTSKYTLITFFPIVSFSKMKSLIVQKHRLVLVLAVLSSQFSSHVSNASNASNASIPFIRQSESNSAEMETSTFSSWVASCFSEPTPHCSNHPFRHGRH